MASLFPSAAEASPGASAAHSRAEADDGGCDCIDDPCTTAIDAAAADFARDTGRPVTRPVTSLVIAPSVASSARKRCRSAALLPSNQEDFEDFDADGVDAAAATYAAYQRKRQRRATAKSSPTAERAAGVADDEKEATAAQLTAFDTSGFSRERIYCTSCRTLKPEEEFYQSCLRRNVFYCKVCSRAKQTRASASTAVNGSTTTAAAATPAASASAVTAPGSKSATQMLNRLRRSRRRAGESGVGFDAHVTRALLAHWGHVSPLTLRQAEIANAQRRAATTNSVDAKDLHLAVWTDREEPTELQPWDVVPVTRAQLARLHSMPRPMWSQALDGAVLTRIDAHLAKLRRQILACNSNGQSTPRPSATIVDDDDDDDDDERAAPAIRAVLPAPST